MSSSIVELLGAERKNGLVNADSYRLLPAARCAVTRRRVPSAFRIVHSAISNTDPNTPRHRRASSFVSSLAADRRHHYDFAVALPLDVIES